MSKEGKRLTNLVDEQTMLDAGFNSFKTTFMPLYRGHMYYIRLGQIDESRRIEGPLNIMLGQRIIKKGQTLYSEWFLGTSEGAVELITEKSKPIKNLLKRKNRIAGRDIKDRIQEISNQYPL